MRTPTVPARLAISLIACLLAATAATAAVTGSPGPGRTVTGKKTDAPPSRDKAAAVSSEHRSLGILRRSQTPRDEMPDALVERLETHSSPLGANYRLARKALRTTDGQDYYVIPANGAICLTSNLGSGACTSPEEIAAGRFIGSEACAAGLRPGEVRIVGMLPDDARASLLLASGAQQPIDIVDNVYALTVRPAEDLPLDIAWATPSSRGSTPTGLRSTDGDHCGN